MIILVIAFRNVIKHWRQSIASVISISAAFLTLSLFQGYLFDIKDLFDTIYRQRMMFGDVMVEHKDLYSTVGRAEPWKFNLDPSVQKFINETTDLQKDFIDEKVRFLKMNGLVTNGRASLIFSGYGYDLKQGAYVRGQRWHWNALYGNTLEMGENPQSVVVGQTLGQLLSCRPSYKRNYSSLVKSTENDKIGFECDHNQNSIQLSATTQSGQLNAIDADIVGFIDGGFKDVDSKFVNLSLESAQRLLNTDNISHETFLLKDPEFAQQFIKQAQAKADAAQIPIKFQTWKQHKYYGDTYERTMGLLGIFRNFVVIIILTIATLSVLNTLIKVVKERTREIGTLRSLGYQKNKITLIFVAEAAGLSILGNAFGIVGTLLFSFLLNHSGLVYKAGMFVEPAPLTVAINFSIYAQCFVFLTILSMVAAIGALRFTLNQKIAENLSYA